MSAENKRKITMQDENSAKRVKKECSYGESCYRRNPAHFREFSHPHLEAILDNYTGDGDYPIPTKFSLQRHMIQEQIEVIVEKQLYVPRSSDGESSSTSTTETKTISNTRTEASSTKYSDTGTTSDKNGAKAHSTTESAAKTSNNQSFSEKTSEKASSNDREKSKSPVSLTIEKNKEEGKKSPTSNASSSRDTDYRPILPPTRRAEDFLKVVRPRGNMAAKHAASAPYYIFYTTITDARETHTQAYSITFQEILDSSLGELKCSLQINFMVELGWLLAQYYFAGYSQKRLTILYGEDSEDLRTINKKKPHVDAHHISMPTPFGKHHTKMMILCYEDGSLRVVISTANLYYDDWENRTQGLWFSPKCPELPADAMPHDGESPTMFKRCLLKYLNHYHLPQLTSYVERVKRCDFSHINVFLVASVPGSHFDAEWGMARAATLLRQHCAIPAQETRQWPLIAQASSLGSYGKEAKLWLTGDFLHNFTKIKQQPQTLSSPPDIKLIYPSLENVQQSHDGLLGGGCLPYAAEAHSKQPWLNNYLFQWRATHTARNKAMPHIKSYTRVSKDASLSAFYLLTSANVSKAAWGTINKGNAACRIMSYEAGVLLLPRFVSYTRVSKDASLSAFYLLTSANVSKAAWGTINKGNAACRIMSYEAGVLLLPRFVINEDFFPLTEGSRNRLVIPYDLPPTKYTSDMSPWVSDYLM